MSLIYLILIATVFQSIIWTNSLYNMSNYEYPLPSLPSDKIKTIAILGTNDMHGAIVSTDKSATINGAKQAYKTGGVSLLGSFLKAMREEFNDSFIWLDSGDQFQGTLESNYFKGESMEAFYNFAKLQGSTLGNHEFDFGIEGLESRLKQANYPYLVANFYNKTTNDFVKMTDVFKSTIVNTTGLKIGIIGLMTLETPTTTAFKFTNYTIKDYNEIINKEAKMLKEVNKTDIIIVVAHCGMTCSIGNVTELTQIKVRNSTTQKTTCSSTVSDELYNIMINYNQSYVDAFIGGHVHSTVHHWINGMPAMTNPKSLESFNTIYLQYDTEKKQVLREKTVIEGPIPICSKVFEKAGNCLYLANTSIWGNLTDFSFHNYNITEDNETLKVLEKYINNVTDLKKKVIGKIGVAMTANKEKENSMGNFIADFLKSITQADVGLYNPGGIRISTWDSGNLTFGNVFEAYPFDNQIITVDMTGKELIEAMRILQNGKKGYYVTSGLREEVTTNTATSTKYWVSTKLANGSNIDLNRTYTVGSILFLFQGGDDFADVIKTYNPRNVQIFSDSFQNNLLNYFDKKWANKVINDINNPIIDPNNPRLTVLDNSDITLPGKDFKIFDTRI